MLYMPPDVLNPEGEHEGARCGRCMMFMPDLEACTIVHEDDSDSTEVSGKKGVCGLYVGGEPMESNEHHKPMPTVPRSVAGYYEGEGVPTHCGNCRYFLAVSATGKPAERGECRKVKGTVHRFGCCNHYEVKNGR